jgi:hypothetical protein
MILYTMLTIFQMSAKNSCIYDGVIVGGYVARTIHACLEMEERTEKLAKIEEKEKKVDAETFLASGPRSSPYAWLSCRSLSSCCY